MKVTSTSLPGVLIIEPTVFTDARGFFYESFNQKVFNQATGLNETFVQDNVSRSARNVLRGLHYQICNPQGKLVRVISGAVFDVAVDIRRGSATFGKWVGLELSERNYKQLWIPAGFAHGFLVTDNSAELMYKTTDYYSPEYERCIAWQDPSIAINWPLTTPPQLATKDKAGTSFMNAEVFK